MVNTIPLLTLEARIKRRLRRHLKELGFVKDEDGFLQPPDMTKATLRTLHNHQRTTLLKDEKQFINAAWNQHRRHFAAGNDVKVEAISPRIELVSSRTWQAELFRLAALTWSIPLSQGYGRRMRFLIWDSANDKLIGLIALGDPVFNLRVRDEWIGWDVAARKERLVNVLDAFVLGAVPPYSMLLGGKLVASLVCTTEIANHFAYRYREATGVISKSKKSPSLVLVTTASAFGRSSIYNRLRLKQRVLFRSLGFTEGWGHFHIPDDLFALIRQYLTAKGHAYSSSFNYGNGPNWKIRAVREALTSIGFNGRILKHGIQREVFACELASNARDILAGREVMPDFAGLHGVAEVGALARERWLLPRAHRDQSYLTWERDNLRGMLTPSRADDRTGKKRRVDVAG